jgi:hypothetical protein
MPTFPCLDVPLEGVAPHVQQLGHDGVADRMAQACSATASVRLLLQDHRRGESGSPGAVGSTKASRSRSSFASRTVADFRPPPGRRLRSGGADGQADAAVPHVLLLTPDS